MRNCPNCSAPLEPYECRCKFCGTWYFDFTSFDMTSNDPYYVKFRTDYGVITTLAKPELQTIDINDDYVDITDGRGNIIGRFCGSRTCDLGVIFHALPMKDKKDALYILETEDK